MAALCHGTRIMFAHAFRFNPTRFDSTRLHAAFAPRKPRHPLLRMAFGLVGLALLLALVVFGVFIGAAMLAGGLLYRLLRQRDKPAVEDSRVVEGQFRVVDKSALPFGR